MMDEQKQTELLRQVYRAGGGDMEATIPALMQTGFPKEAMGLQQHQAQAQQLAQTIRDAAQKHIGNTMYGADTPEKWKAQRENLPEQLKTITPEDFSDAHYSLVKSWAISADKQAELAAKDRQSQAILGSKYVVDGSGQVLQMTPPTAPGELPRYDRPMGKPKPPKAAGGGPGGAGGGDILSPEAIEAAAQRYNQTQELPALGVGKAGGALKAKILNRAAILAAGANTSLNKAQYKADSGSLGKLQAQADIIEAFEQKAAADMDIFMGAAKEVVDAGSPLWNKPLREIRNKLGSDKVAKFKTARTAIVTEYAKILSGATGSAGASDSARHEAEQMLPEDASLAQIDAAMGVLKKDAHNRTSTLANQMSAIRERLSGKKAAPEGGGDARAPLTPAEKAELEALRKEHGQ